MESEIFSRKGAKKNSNAMGVFCGFLCAFAPLREIILKMLHLQETK